jgi:hypothetical protein
MQLCRPDPLRRPTRFADPLRPVELLDAAARLRATRTLGKQTPRMVKRRNSPYASHNRSALIRVDMNREPKMLDPPPLHRRQRFPTEISI